MSFLPPSVQNAFVLEISEPILKVMMKLIIAATIPVIFISIVASICSVGDTETLNKVGKRVFIRFLVIMLLIEVGTIAICFVFFPVVSLDNYEESLNIGEVLKLFLSAVPSNAVTPFSEGNVVQVVLVAIMMGISVILLGNQIEYLHRIINECKMIVFKLMELILKVIPPVIFLSIFNALITSTLESVSGAWKIVAVQYIAFILMAVIMLARIAIRYDVNIKEFLKKLYPALMIVFTTASSSASMAKNIEICKRDFGIDDNFADFWIPLSHTLFASTMVNALITCSFYAAVFSGTTVSLMQLLIMSFLAIQFSVVTIRVPGGMVATLSILFSQLGFSLGAIGPICAVDIFVVNISGVVGMIVRDCELIDVAHQMNFVHESGVEHLHG